MSSIASGGDRTARDTATRGALVEDRAGVAASRGLSALMLTWALALPLAPMASASGGAVAAGSAIVYAAGSVVCHQRPERSFTTAGRPWPVCARCSGIYCSAAVVAAAGLLARWRRSLRADPAVWRLRFFLALVPIALTWVIEQAGIATITNGIRALSGVCLGGVVSAAVQSIRGGGLVGRPKDLG